MTQILKDARAQKLKANLFFDNVEVRGDEEEDESKFTSELEKSLSQRKNLRHSLL